jgi:adenylate cyclase
LGIEIERKFLIANDTWRKQIATSKQMRQGYVSTGQERSVRVRVVGNSAKLTIKKRVEGATRLEFEYEIPALDAEVILDEVCDRPLIEKTRHIVEHQGMTWEIDEFSGDNQGLILAEVELEREDQTFEKPAWAGRDVTDDTRFYNASLVSYPYRKWSDSLG